MNHEHNYFGNYVITKVITIIPEGGMNRCAKILAQKEN